MNNQVKETVKTAIKFGALQATAHPVLLMDFASNVTEQEDEAIDALQVAFEKNTEAYDALDKDSEVVLELLTELKDELVAHMKEFGVDSFIIKPAILYSALKFIADSIVVKEFENAKTDEEKELLTSMREAINENIELYEAMNNDSDTVAELLNELKVVLIHNAKKAELI